MILLTRLPAEPRSRFLSPGVTRRCVPLWGRDSDKGQGNALSTANNTPTLVQSAIKKHKKREAGEQTSLSTHPTVFTHDRVRSFVQPLARNVFPEAPKAYHAHTAKRNTKKAEWPPNHPAPPNRLRLTPSYYTTKHKSTRHKSTTTPKARTTYISRQISI